jgi:hypothetical protein
MQGIEFEENNELRELSPSVIKNSAEKPSFFMRLLEKAGVADKTTASFILLGVAALFFSIAIYIYSGLHRNTTTPKLTREQLQYQTKMLRELRDSKQPR